MKKDLSNRFLAWLIGLSTTVLSGLVVEGVVHVGGRFAAMETSIATMEKDIALLRYKVFGVVLNGHEPKLFGRDPVLSGEIWLPNTHPLKEKLCDSSTNCEKTAPH